jgi:glyoxylase-like metal-dependent hydrolase (beta-lactamase superfamily II)
MAVPSLEHLFENVLRLTLPLPTGPRHVHSYLVRGDEGWLIVDTGLGLPEDEHPWAAVAASLDAPLRGIVVTHFHPDHVGGAERAAAVTRATVHQGELDYEQCERVWGTPDWPDRIAAWFVRNGAPPETAELLIAEGHAYAPFIRYARDPRRLRPGDLLEGWEVVATPGHADGHLCLHRDGVLVAGDHLLGEITPAVGLYPDSRPDPLGDYLDSLERTIALAPRVALPGHGEPLDDPAARARELVEHHRLRLDETEAALDERPRSGFEVSFDVFGSDLDPAARRFAVAETLSHLERLVREARARRRLDDGAITYTAP